MSGTSSSTFPPNAAISFTPLDETKLEMEDWADGILSTLEVNLDKFLGAVRRGRERLHERSQESVMAGLTDESIE